MVVIFVDRFARDEGNDVAKGKRVSSPLHDQITVN